MDNTLRICIAGRYYDIPLQGLSPSTINHLKSLMDDRQNINAKELLKAFLEASESNNILKDSIQKTIELTQNI